MDFSVISNNRILLFEGFITTVNLTILSILGGAVVGVALALGRISTNRLLSACSTVVIEVSRGTPALMLIFWIYFLLPRLTGHAVSSYTAALSSLIMFNAAYIAEIIRAGISSVPRGLVEAGLSSGIRHHQIMRHIVLPPAIANMLPALTSQMILAYKTTSLVFVVGVIDLFRAANIINNREFKSVEIYLFVALVYFVPCFILSLISRYLATKKKNSMR